MEPPRRMASTRPAAESRRGAIRFGDAGLAPGLQLGAFPQGACKKGASRNRPPDTPDTLPKLHPVRSATLGKLLRIVLSIRPSASRSRGASAVSSGSTFSRPCRVISPASSMRRGSSRGPDPVREAGRCRGHGFRDPRLPPAWARDLLPTIPVRTLPVQTRKGFEFRSSPTVLTGPWPGRKVRSSPSGRIFSLMERISVA